LTRNREGNPQEQQGYAKLPASVSRGNANAWPPVTPGTTATSYRDLLLAEIHERAPFSERADGQRYRLRLKQAFRSPSTAPLLERHPSLPPVLQHGKALIHGLLGEL
jgi:hypothetical protein